MNKLLKKIFVVLSLAIMITILPFNSFAYENLNEENGVYVLNVGDQVIRLKEGEEVSIPMVAPKEGNVSTYEDFYGDVGKLTLSPGNGRVYYHITLSIPADTFSGNISLTNINTGQTGGYMHVSKFSGSIGYNGIKGHRYISSLNGRAYRAGKLVAYTMPNSISWTH